MDLEYETSMVLLIFSLTFFFGFLIWKVSDCKLEKSFDVYILVFILVLFGLYSYTIYNLQKDCKKVNCNPK